MILVAMIGYYVFAVGVLVLIGYAVAQQSARRFKVQADVMIAHLERFRTHERADEVADGSGRCGDTGTTAPFTNTTALVLTFRSVPELTVDAMVGMTSLLIRRVIDREVELGGEGMTFFPSEVTPGSKRVEVRLVPTKLDGAAGRVATLIAELNSGSRKAKDSRNSDGGNLADLISQDSTAALPESGLRQLELAAVA